MTEEQKEWEEQGEEEREWEEEREEQREWAARTSSWPRRCRPAPPASTGTPAGGASES